MADTIEHASAAASREQITLERAEQQRQQRVLQLEQQIDGVKTRLARCRTLQREAQRRLELANERASERAAELAALEQELGRLEGRAEPAAEVPS